MATTKITPIKRTVKAALDYILNPDKTDGKLLASSFGCSYETADLEFEFTRRSALGKGNNLAHHLIQSFAPGEADAKQAHEIGRQLADEVLQGKYEYVLATHIDKGHIHNHIIFNAVDFVNYRKYNSNKGSLYGIRKISDRLCRENGLSTVIPGKGERKGQIEYTDRESGERLTRPAEGAAKSYAEYLADLSGGGSYKSKLRRAIDMAIPLSTDFDDFLFRMVGMGYEVKRGKHISFRAAKEGQERFTRAKALGEDYTEERITARIADGARSMPALRADSKPVSLIIDLQNNIKAQQSKGYEHWAKINNLKQAAKTLNYLTENNILHYEKLTGKIEEVATAAESARATLKEAEKKLAVMAAIVKNADMYQRTKAIYDEYRTSKNPEKYKRDHESEIILHEAAARTLKAAGVGKSMDARALRSDYEKLSVEKARLSAEYGKLKREVKGLDVIKRNIDSILNPPADRPRDRGIEI